MEKLEVFVYILVKQNIDSLRK